MRSEPKSSLYDLAVAARVYAVEPGAGSPEGWSGWDPQEPALFRGRLWLVLIPSWAQQRHGNLGSPHAGSEAGWAVDVAPGGALRGTPRVLVVSFLAARPCARHLGLYLCLKNGHRVFCGDRVREEGVAPGAVMSSPFPGGR